MGIMACKKIKKSLLYEKTMAEKSRKVYSNIKQRKNHPKRRMQNEKANENEANIAFALDSLVLVDV